MISEIAFLSFFKRTVGEIERDITQESIARGKPNITEVYQDNTLWTEKILDYLDGRNYLYNNKTGLKGIPGEYHLRTEREYYRTDLIAYKSTPEISKNELRLIDIFGIWNWLLNMRITQVIGWTKL